ncbi:outer membrane beta-barrel protein [Proteiniphilum acetatigenes]|uniref:outer membrane beta-barrel protein n=1 Tax=Proteiniphilum acetatigenes TaxID=294710 RepID=UPI0009D9C47F|nr:outer membrane beta-barrel protein [Proteiniphilum acetatigenes]
MMLKKTTIIVFCLLSVMIVYSQERHEISVSVAGGLSTINYSPNVGQSKDKIGSTIGFGYNYKITNYWSIGSGVEMLISRSEYSMENFSDSYAAYDGEDDFIFHTTVKEYSESQNISYLNIPFVVMFQRPIAGKNSFFASAGFKFGVPVVQRVDVSALFNNYGYYPKWENPIKDNPYFMGFGDFGSENVKGNLEVKTLYLLSVESGMKWILGNKLNLYSGIYCDYGLNNIQKASDKRMIQYNNMEPSEYIHNSVINSSYSTDDNITQALVDVTRIISVGVKLRLALDL